MLPSFFVFATPLAEWYGDVPILSSGRMVTREGARSLMHGRDVQILGDSLARRLAATWFDFMEHVRNETVEDATLLGAGGNSSLGSPFGHKGVSWTARYPNASVRRFDVAWAPRPLDLCPILRATADVVVIALGVHCAINLTIPGENLPGPAALKQCVHDLRNASTCVCRNQTSQLIIWRLAPLMWSAVNFKELQSSLAINSLVRAFNEHVRHWQSYHCRQVVLVDGEALLQHRDVGEARLAGDTPYHFSYPARFVQVQAILQSIHEATSGGGHGGGAKSLSAA